MKWQPIETAPVDELVLVGGEDIPGWHALAYWGSLDEEWMLHLPSDEPLYFTPTYWHPLPEDE